MTLLADDQLGPAMKLFHLRLPLEVLFRAGLRLAVLGVVILANTNITTSASCSMEPDSRRSLSCGRLSSRLSTARESCDSATIGTFSSFASALRLVVISVNS